MLYEKKVRQKAIDSNEKNIVCVIIEAPQKQRDKIFQQNISHFHCVILLILKIYCWQLALAL